MRSRPISAPAAQVRPAAEWCLHSDAARRRFAEEGLLPPPLVKRAVLQARFPDESDQVLDALRTMDASVTNLDLVVELVRSYLQEDGGRVYSAAEDEDEEDEGGEGEGDCGAVDGMELEEEQVEEFVHECRLDGDGHCYTKAEFLQYYGSATEWEAAAVPAAAEDPTDPSAAASSSPPPTPNAASGAAAPPPRSPGKRDGVILIFLTGSREIDELRAALLGRLGSTDGRVRSALGPGLARSRPTSPDLASFRLIPPDSARSRPISPNLARSRPISPDLA